MKECYLVIDYNNIRFKDVLKIRRYVRDRYGLQLCLIRPNPTAVDYQVADHVLDLELGASDFVERAENGIRSLGLSIIGGFPFSDKAVLPGTQLLNKLGCRSDSEKLAAAADSKWDYRQIESRHLELLHALNVFTPQVKLLSKIEQLHEMLRSCPAGVVLKPTHEGNNRGVSMVRTAQEADRAWREALPWFRKGLLAEEIIPFAAEFSHDGVAHLDFVTKKLSLSGTYPVEKGQEVSESLTSQITCPVRHTGRLVNFLDGSRIGAFHNEIRLEMQSGMTAVVEPNRRPAGMCIWDLAEKVYRTSFYALLVDSTMGEILPTVLPKPRGAAAVRMLSAASDGVWRGDADELIRWQKDLTTELTDRSGGRLEFFNFRMLVANGAMVTSIPRNNGDFLAQICVFSEDTEIVQQALDDFEIAWLEKIKNQSRERYDNRYFASGAI